MERMGLSPAIWGHFSEICHATQEIDLFIDEAWGGGGLVFWPNSFLATSTHVEANITAGNLLILFT